MEFSFYMVLKSIYRLPPKGPETNFFGLNLFKKFPLKYMENPISHLFFGAKKAFKKKPFAIGFTPIECSQDLFLSLKANNCYLNFALPVINNVTISNDILKTSKAEDFIFNPASYRTSNSFNK
jgi:hypothetical protein